MNTITVHRGKRKPWVFGFHAIADVHYHDTRANTYIIAVVDGRLDVFRVARGMQDATAYVPCGRRIGATSIEFAGGGVYTFPSTESRK